MIAPLLLAAGLVLAQSDPAALLADDLKFAENLALYRYYDLSLGVIGDVKRDVERLSDDDLEGEASLTEARVLMRQADNTADVSESLAIRNQAIELLGDWAVPGSGFAYHDRLVDALQDLAALLRDRGTVHARRYAEGEEGARDAAEADFDKAEEVYDRLQEEALGIADQEEEAGNIDTANAFRERAALTLYFRGINGIEWADVSDDPELRLEQSFDFLDDFMWEQPEENLVTFMAMYEMARAAEKMGDPDEAASLLENIRERLVDEYWQYCGVTANPEYRFAPVAERQIGDLLDQVWGYRARLAADAGDMDAADQWIQTLLDEHDRTEVPIGRQGFKVLVDWARTLEGLGQNRRATEIVKIVTDSARGTAEGEIAEVMLAELVRGGGAQDPDVLMQAARGHVTKGEWSDAAFNYQRAAAGLSSAEDLAEMGYEAWMGAGQALRRLARHLEAAVAFDQALEVGLAHGSSDEEIEQAASMLYGSYDQRYKATGDAFDKTLRDETSARLVAIPDVDLDLAYMAATEAFNDVEEGDVQGYLAVRAELEAVPESSPNYEKALVLLARSLAGAGRIDEALAAFQAVEARDDDPALTPTNATGRKRRQGAMALARYYHASLLLQDGVTRPEEALSVLEGFETQLDEQQDMFPNVKYKRVEAYAMAGQIDEAEQALVDLQESGGRATLIAAGAYKVGSAAESAARMAQGLGDAARGRDLLQRAAQAMWLYSDTSGHPSVANLMTTGEWYLEAEDPGAAEDVFATALEVVERQRGSDTYKGNLQRARMGLATAYDEQRDFGRSRPLWQELRAANADSPQIKRGAARCFGGWMEQQDDGSIVEIKGSGDFAEAITLWTELARGYKVQAKYTKEWWEATLGAVYGYYNLRNLEPDKGAAARKVIDSLKLNAPQFDKDTIDQLDPDQKYEPLFQPLFRYLDRQLPT